MSHDDTQSQSQSQSQSQPASLMSSGGTDHLVRNVSCQTEIDLLDQLFQAWTKPPTGTRRTLSQKYDKRRVGSTGSAGSADLSRVVGTTPMRSLTERRHVRHRAGRGSDSAEYRNMVGYRLQSSSGEEASPGLRRGMSESPLIRRDSSGEEEVKYVLDKRSRKSLGDSESTGPSEGGSESDVPRDDLQLQNRKRPQKASAPPPAQSNSGGLTGLFAESLGSTFTTFLGTAVHVEDPDEFCLTTEITEVPSARRGSVLGESLGSTVEALIPTALAPRSRASLRQRFAEEHIRSPSPKTPRESPKLERRGSVLFRLGKSIKRHVRKGLESLSASKDRSNASSPARSVENDNQNRLENVPSPLPPLKKYRVTQTHMINSPEHTSTSKRVLETQDSDAADSGVILKLGSFDKGISFDSSGQSRSEFDTDSSKHSSAKSKPGSSLRRTAQGITHKLDEQFVKHQVSEFSMEWNSNVELSSASGCALSPSNHMHLIVQHSDSTPWKTRTPHVSQTALIICV